MTKDRKIIKALIDQYWNERNQAVEAMEPQKNNPQIALMIEKNKGYIMALEDITDFLYKTAK